METFIPNFILAVHVLVLVGFALASFGWSQNMHLLHLWELGKVVKVNLGYNLQPCQSFKVESLKQLGKSSPSYQYHCYHSPPAKPLPSP